MVLSQLMMTNLKEKSENQNFKGEFKMKTKNGMGAERSQRLADADEREATIEMADALSTEVEK